MYLCHLFLPSNRIKAFYSLEDWKYWKKEKLSQTFKC